MFRKYKYRFGIAVFCLLFVIIVHNIMFAKRDESDLCHITDKIRYDLINMKTNEVIKRLNGAGAMEGELNLEKIRYNCANIVGTIPEDTLLNEYNKFLKNIK